MRNYITALIIAVGVIAWGTALAGATPVAAATGSTNDIIQGGASSITALRSSYKNKTPSDIQAIYGDSRYGITQSVIMNDTVRTGSVTDKGEVLDANGKVIATGAKSLGRENISPSTKVTIANKTYYERSTSVSLVSSPLKAYLFYGSDGRLDGIIIADCGNPVRATPKPVPTPTIQCTGLTEGTPISRTEKQFTAKGSATNGATITSYNFALGDGTSSSVATGASSATVRHTYKNTGTYRVTVTVTANINGKSVTTRVGTCATAATVKAAPVAPICSKLTLVARDTTTRTYGFRAATQPSNAAINSIDLNFGDGTNQTGIKAADLPSVTHRYTGTQAYIVTMTIRFADAARTAATCSAPLAAIATTTVVTPSPSPSPSPTPTPTPTPDLKNAPIELPSTGPADVLGGGLGFGSLAAAGYYYRNSRKLLMSRLLKR